MFFLDTYIKFCVKKLIKFFYFQRILVLKYNASNDDQILFC